MAHLPEVTHPSQMPHRKIPARLAKKAATKMQKTQVTRSSVHVSAPAPIRKKHLSVVPKMGRMGRESGSVPQRVSTALGIFFLFLGVLGFLIPNAFGTHLSTAHNFIHLGSGLLALYFGLWHAPYGAARFDWTFGAIYGALGISGFVFGTSGLPFVPGMMQLTEDRFYFPLVPGTLEIGTADHVLNLLIAFVFIVGAAAWSPVKEEFNLEEF